MSQAQAIQEAEEALSKGLAKQGDLQVRVEVFPVRGILKLSTMRRLDIAPHDTFLNFEVVETMYLAVLQARAALRGQPEASPVSSSAVRM